MNEKKPLAWLRDPLLKGAFINGLVEICAQTFILFAIFQITAHPYKQIEFRFFLMLILALVIDAAALRQYNWHLIQYVESRIANRRRNVMDKVCKTSLTTFEKVGPEKIYTALTYDVGEISSLAREIGHTARVASLLLIWIIRLAVLSSVSCAIAAGYFCAMAGVFCYVQIKFGSTTSKARKKEKLLFDSVRDLLDGFKELRLNDEKSKDFFNFSIRVRASELRRVKSLNFLYFIYSYLIVHALWFGAIFALIFFVPLMIPSLSDTLTLSVSILIMIPKGFLVREVPKIIKANISVQRLNRFESLMEQLAPEPPGEAEETEFAEIRYENILFQYEGEKDQAFSVGPVSMDVRYGEILFVTGGNGSGKSTFLKLISGLYPMRSGSVRFNGKEIRMEEYRWLFSAIFTDYHLFDRLYGIESIDEARVDALLRMFQLDNKVKFRKEAFNTNDLSTGQKKRLALLMSMLEDKPIYIFDEWAADQDPQFRRYFYETLLPSFKAQGKAVIAVTHDDRWFDVADKIIKLDYGQIARL